MLLAHKFETWPRMEMGLPCRSDLLIEVMYSDLWEFDKTRQREHPVQQETETIAVRMGKQQMGVRFMDSHVVVDGYHIDKFPIVMRFCNMFLQEFGGELGRVNLVRLPPEKQVYEHIDAGRYYADRDRFHYVIQGTYDYTVQGNTHRFSQGEFWWFDNQVPHSAVNVGTDDRIVLIFDVKGASWRDRESV